MTQGRFFCFLSMSFLMIFLFSQRILHASRQSIEMAQKAITIPLVDLAAQKGLAGDRGPGARAVPRPSDNGPAGRPKNDLMRVPRGHGKGAICLKKSTDGGLSWSDRLPVPENWATSLETPTIYRVIDRAGRKRLILFSGLYPCRMSVSENDGESWTPLAAVGDWGGIVTMSSLVRLKNGDDMALFHDDGRFFKKTGLRPRS